MNSSQVMVDQGTLGRDTVQQLVAHTAASELYLLEGDGSEEGGWQERGLCAQTDPEAFFPEKGGSTREAKKVCLTCDAQAEEARGLTHGS